MKRLIAVCYQWLFISLFFLPSISLLSQENLGRQTILQFDLNHSVLKAPAPALEKSVPMSRGRSSAAFLGGVGGVSFDQVALPGNKLSVNQVSLNYAADHDDGARLDIMINGVPVKAFLPDWLLAPITRFAESPYFSCVTLFGELEDTELQELIIDRKGRVINYHPAFENTLLGIRLLYMDMLVGYPFTTDLPKNDKGMYLLGMGEMQPDLTSNQNGAYYLSQHLISAENKSKEQFRSYVITDFSQQIIFEVKNDSLVISGNPYYYCWKFNRDRQGYDMQQVGDAIAAKYNLEIVHQQKASGDEGAQNYLVDRLIQLAEQYDGNFSFYQEGTFVEMMNLPPEDRKDFLGQYSLESLFEMAVQTETYMDADSIVYLEDYSEIISSKPELFEAMNPAVWNATVATMRYAAFFRYVKTNFPQTWLSFYNQVKEIDPDPRITTPTVMYDPDCKTLEETFKERLK